MKKIIKKIVVILSLICIWLLFIGKTAVKADDVDNYNINSKALLSGLQFSVCSSSVAPIYAGNKKLPPVYGHAAAVFPGSCSDNSARFLRLRNALSLFLY